MRHAEAIERRGEVILAKLGSDESSVPRYARRFIDKVAVVPDRITISGRIKPLELVVDDDNDQQTPTVPSLDREWCRLQDSNL
jgi:site-specific DNA recombinase